MDALEVLLTLGRARGVTARQLRAAAAQLIPQIDPPTTASLRALIGQPEATLRRLGLPPAVCAALAVPDAVRIGRDRAWVERQHVQLIGLLDPDYPPRLGQLPGAPAVLYVRGQRDALCAPQLAVVGSRKPTAQGLGTSRLLAMQLARAGLTVTSGLALGIDGAAHAGALEGAGRTIAVLANGLDRIYPLEHSRLAERIASHGALISELPPDTAPRRQHFPLRNRLIAGLALGTLVIEASTHSGSLLTARLAARYGRCVFAVPGSIHSPQSSGCHALIRGGATLVERSADVLQKLALPLLKQYVMSSPCPPPEAVAGLGSLDKGYEILLDALGFGLTSFDSLVERTGLPSQSVASMLLILELEGAVRAQAGGRYMRIQSH